MPTARLWELWPHLHGSRHTMKCKTSCVLPLPRGMIGLRQVGRAELAEPTSLDCIFWNAPYWEANILASGLHLTELACQQAAAQTVDLSLSFLTVPSAPRLLHYPHHNCSKPRAVVPARCSQAYGLHASGKLHKNHMGGNQIYAPMNE